MTQAPGWYREPTDPSLIRFWDGSTWTEQRVLPPSEWAQPGATQSPGGGAPSVPAPRLPTGQQPGPAPGGANPRSPSGKKLWYLIGGSAAVAVVIVVTAVALAGKGGTGGTGGGAGGTGGTVDYAQYQLDVELTGSLSLTGLTPLPGTQATDPTASDCAQAAADVGRLQADSRTWPAVLSVPMSKAEDAFSAATKDCSSQDFTTMQTDLGRGQGYLSATKDAFAAHCRPSDTDAFKWQC